MTDADVQIPMQSVEEARTLPLTNSSTTILPTWSAATDRPI